jgi:hypothetical protein
MNRTIFYLSIVFAISWFGQNASASVIDTLYADSTYFGVESGVTNPINAFGKPDDRFAKLTAVGVAPQFDVIFYRHSGSVVTKTILPIKPKSRLIIYGKKDSEVDSSAGAVSLCWFDALQNLQQTAPYILNGGADTIDVPDTTFEYLEFTLPGVGLTQTYSKSYYIDAIALLEDTAQAPSIVYSSRFAVGTGIIRNYPNPFQSSTSVAFSMPTNGNATLVAVDMQGKEQGRTELGYLDNGDHRAMFELSVHGMYFLRLFVNGMPVGNPIKVVSQ